MLIENRECCHRDSHQNLVPLLDSDADGASTRHQAAPLVSYKEGT